MSADHNSENSHRATDDLLDALRRWRDADRRGPREPLIPRLRALDTNRIVVEQAKGVLMHRFGIDSHEAFAVLVRWSRVRRTPVHTTARTVLREVAEATP